MNRKILLITAALLIAVLALSACRGLIPETGVNQQELIETQNALIVQAAQVTATQMAMATQIAQLQTQVASGGSAGEPVVVTATAEPGKPVDLPATLPPSATVPPTNTPVPPTNTPVPPTNTPVPPTATPIPCNLAQFQGDVTIPDGSTLSAGSTFTKTWRLKNIGSCTWTTNYDLVFVSGDSMSGPAAVDFQGNVAPGQVVDLSVNLTAPGSTGSYRGYWRLRDGAGNHFGLSNGSNFYVDIKVASINSEYPLDFAASYCLATWTSGAGNLACPGTTNDSRGYVTRIDKPTLESGYVDDQPALLTSPQMVTDGVIRGKFPAYRVHGDDRFKAVIGCANKADQCDVIFQLDYQIGNGSITNLTTWHEVYDEQFRSVEVDLSGLAGQDVKFILTILANGEYNQDRALWLAPRVTNK